MNPTHFLGAIFDLDGVIADTARLHFAAWSDLAEKEGFCLDPSVHDRLKGVDRLGSLAIVLESAPRFYDPQEQTALAEWKNRRYRALIESLTPADMLPGADDLLRWLSDRGIPVALASASKNARPVLAALGIAQRFDYIADAARIPEPKPHPAIFLDAAAGLGLAPERCLGFEDAPAGVVAIKAAGMAAVGVGDATLLAGADWIVPGLREVDAERYFGHRV